jgi:flagellin
MLSIQSNFAQSVAMNSLNKNSDMLSTAMERLGTGFRINSAADDAAGLQIANRLTVQSRGMGVAQDNVANASNLLSTADASLDEMNSIGLRMKDLVTQSANDTNSTADRTALNSEYTELKAEVTRISTQTSFGGELLLEGGKLGTGPLNFQIGAGAAEVMAFDASAAVTAISGAYTATTGIVDGTDFAAELGLVDTFISSVGALRSSLGANINRLDHTANNLAAVTQGTENAAGRIMDADFAVESSQMSKQQMLMQSGISVLSNAGQTTQLIGSLLR